MENEKEIALKKFNKEGFSKEQAVALTNAGVKDLEVAQLLTGPNIFAKVIKEQDKTIEGELKARMCISLIAFGGRVTENAEPTSKNLCVNDESGVGKDWVTSHVCELLSDRVYTKRIRISPTVLTYWHNAKFEPDWTWEGKVLYLEDVSSKIYNSDPFKLMASNDKPEVTSTITVNQMPVDIIIRGKPVMIVTSASATPGKELLRRFPILNLDSSREQTKAILKRKAKEVATGIKAERDLNITKALSSLQLTNVKIPFAEKLVEHIPDQHPIVRTSFNRLLDLIKFSTALHQFQRKTDNDDFLISEKLDYSIGSEAFLAMLQQGRIIPLTKDQQKILDVLQKEEEGMTAKEVSTIMPISYVWTLKLLDKMAEAGVIGKEPGVREGSDKKVAVYSYSEPHKIKLPKWSELETEEGD